MTQPLYLSYFAEQDGEKRWGLSIHLEQDRFERPPHEWLQGLHAAADAWRQDFPNVFLRSELGIEPEPECRRASLISYLYASGEINGPRLGRHLTMLRETGTIHRFTVRPGAYAEGADLVGRQGRIADLLKILESGSCHLRAPRRYGKSSILRHLLRMFSATGHPCLLADISSGQTAVWFLVTLARAAMDSSCRSAVASLPELARSPSREASPVEKSRAFEQLREDISPNPWSFGRRLLEALGQAGAVLLIDEFSVFLRETHAERPDEARALSDLLASSRRSGSPTRQVFAGSTGLSSYMHFHNLGESFADLVPLDLPPLTRPEAFMLAEELLYGAHQIPSPEAVERILDTLGEPIPYFLHSVVSAVLEESPGHTHVTLEEIDRAYTERVLGTSGNEMFKLYSLRNRPYPPPLRRVASRILRELAQRPEGIETDELRRLSTSDATDQNQFQSLLSCLEEDYDLVKKKGRWVMRSKVLRDRWILREPWLTRVE